MSSVWNIFAVLHLAVILSAVSADVTIVSRADWRARPAGNDMTTMQLPLGRAVIAHTASSGCDADESCAERVRGIQTYQMSRLKYSDISYHYLIGGNGVVYEGRSPSHQGAIAAGNNGDSLAIAFLGNFSDEPPTEAALTAAQGLLAQVVSEGKLKEDYKLLGHRQLSATKSPGDALYALIEKWPHWSRP